VKIGGKHWAGTLESILTKVAEGLGITEPIVAELYKFLVYDEGCFFVSHRDTEKSPGMFATLVLALPSASTGGELVVRHKGREVRLDLRCEEPSEAAFAAFYADCVHEVLPVTAGCRATLVFNLLRRGRGPMPVPPSYESEQAGIAALLQAWVAVKKSPDDDSPEKLIYPLEHAYTPAELGFATLKGADAAAATVLVAAAPQADCELHLTLLSIEESGAAEYSDDYGSRRRRGSEEFEAGDVEERDAFLSEWKKADGGLSIMPRLPILDEELSPPDALDDMDPDEEHFHEATGNAGATFERTYRRAALVLWPRDRVFAVLNQAGLGATLPFLDDLTERWAASGERRESPLWRQAHELAGHMLSTWPTQHWHQQDEPSHVGRMLTLLTRLEDTEHIETLVAAIATGGGHGKGDNEAILGALALFSPRRAASLIERVIAGTAPTSPDACAALLARAVAASAGDRRTGLTSAAARLVEALPGDPSRISQPPSWRGRSGVQPGLIADLMTALGGIDETEAARAADYLLAWPGTYGFDSVLIPAMRHLIRVEMIKNTVSLRRLRIACIQHLQSRTAESLDAPQDWKRANALGCRCPNCSELSRFLADPGRRTWIFRAAESDRSHVEGMIRNSRCDVDMTTDRRGRPYSLVCTKNQASYDRRAKQRENDLADIMMRFCVRLLEWTHRQTHT
jgi:hypothetical protein